jgi:PleD family two-component response regulator
MTAKHFIVGNQNGPEPADRPISVLLVDDQAIVAESIRRLLASQDDIQLHVCHEPSQALAMAKAVRPTVILQDLVMPNIDGLLLVKFFRASEATRQT